METFSMLVALCAGNSPVTVNSPLKGQWRGALMFSLICPWLNSWVNNHGAGDLRRHHAFYDVTVMIIITCILTIMNDSSVPKRLQAIIQSIYYPIHYPIDVYLDTKGVNTLRPRQNGCHFPDNIFLNENVWLLINISLKFVPKGPINNIPALVQIMDWRQPDDKALSEPMIVSLLTHIHSIQRKHIAKVWFCINT